MRIVLLLVSFVMGFSLVSCGKESAVLSTRDSAFGPGIIGGTLVSEGSPLASGIVGIYDSAGSGATCTGSLIAEDIVLTAAHCVFESNPEDLQIVFSTDIMTILGTKEPDAAVDYIRQVSQFKFHENYNPEEQETNPFDWSDIAIIRFKGNLPAGYKPAMLLKDSSLLKPGIMVTMAGYGVSKVDVFPVNPKKVRNLSEAIKNGEVICDDDRKDCMTVEMSGDGDLRQTATEVGYVIRSEVRLDESKGHATCSGDSGGPVYIEKDGKYLLFGVTSRGSGLCNGVGVYTNALYYKEWIAQAIKNLR